MQIGDRRLLLHIDWILIVVTLLLALVGLMTIYSATYTRASYIYDKHVYWLIIGSAFFFAALIFDYSLLDRFGYLIFAFSILLLVCVLVFGREVGGAHRWISLGFISFQPSEFTKLALIVALAKYFSTKVVPRKGMELRNLYKPAIILIVPFLLVAKEPDLGTALIFVMIFTTMVLVLKVRRRTLIGILVAFTPLIPLGWFSLKAYQKVRILSFLNPSKAPLGSGYHLLQSKIAIGSGGIFGKGFTNGTQGKLRFLPEHHTDFIFAILAEEWGMLGSFTLLILFSLLILRGLNTARNSKDRFGFLVALGICAMLFWHIVMNLFMVSGMLPVVGVPLPFLSYGGTFLLATLISAGILVNIGMRRHIF